MIASRISLDCRSIRDWPTFHEQFAEVFGFPAFYGKNMNAWIDCMTSLDQPEDRMTSVHCERGTILTLELENVTGFMKKCPEQYEALIESSAFVNWRRIETGDSSVLALSFRIDRN